jgi:hypothetical protein
VRLTDFYAGTANPVPQQVSQGASPDRNTAPAQSMAASGNATAISWIGILIALVLLRIVYEVSD